MTEQTLLRTESTVDQSTSKMIRPGDAMVVEGQPAHSYKELSWPPFS